MFKEKEYKTIKEITRGELDDIKEMSIDNNEMIEYLNSDVIPDIYEKIMICIKSFQKLEKRIEKFERKIR